jgi:hypothetical protein
MIQEHYHNVENVHIANSNILSRNGIISQRFIKSDGRHLSEEGVKVLASNLRLVVEGILGLTNSDTKNNNVHKREIGFCEFWQSIFTQMAKIAIVRS